MEFSILFQDFFTLFQLNPSFQQDEAVIQARYYLLQQKAHPDNFVMAPDAEKQAALQYAAIINDAYRTLKDPYRRALYLLKLQGEDLLKETTTQLPPTLLMEQLELREELADIQPSEHATFAQKVTAALQTLETTLQQLSDQKPLDEIKYLLWQIQFYRKLQDELAQWPY